MLTTKPAFNGDKLRAERERRNWRPEFVAYNIGVSNSAIGHWERGFRSPAGENLVALCRLFGLESSDLFE